MFLVMYQQLQHNSQSIITYVLTCKKLETIEWIQISVHNNSCSHDDNFDPILHTNFEQIWHKQLL